MPCLAKRMIAIAAIVACFACAPHREGITTLSALSTTASTPWWHNSGDPVLDHLLAKALEQNAAPDCYLPGASVRRALTWTLHSAASDRAKAQARGWSSAGQRLARAQRIAQAYMEARAMSARLADRIALKPVVQSDTVLALFRGEAGLVPVLDGDMAGIMQALVDADATMARKNLATSLARLARVTGEGESVLDTLLANQHGVPALSGRLTETADEEARLQADSQQRDQSRAALAVAEQRLTEREGLVTRTAAAVAEARFAYRNGAASFSRLYVAQAEALAAHEALDEARATIGEARVRLWTDEGRGERPLGDACD